MPIVDTSSKILLLDDPALDIAGISRQLETDGHTPIRVGGGFRQVMALLDNEAFDLVVLDVDSASADAVELIGLIRQRFAPAKLPILITTAMPSGMATKLALAAGANDCLAKPADGHEMSLRVRNLIMIRDLYKGQLAIRSHLEREVAARAAKLDLLIENGLMMSVEHDRSKLLQHILIKGQRLLNCDGATMYLVTEQKTLRFALRTRDDLLPLVEIPLFDAETGRPNEKHVSTYAVAHNKSVLIDDVYQETRFDLSGTRRFDAESRYRTVSMLTVPMAPRNGEVIGVLQFMNALEPGTGAIVPFSPDVLVLVEALAAQAAVALDNLQLVEAQKVLIESMIQVIATAIDAKSPYTGRHCSRVPELAVMLAETASETVSGPLADFSFNTADEWREFRIGAWLHDCGKVTTPEYVIDKATKLETIHNRIHEIRMRFEVLLRDSEIERLTALSDGENADEVNARHEARKARLLDDFAFVAECNIGSETMTDDRIERLKRIASVTWLRHLDDRLGLSHADAAQCESEPRSSLPAVEQLLADKPRHLVPRESSDVPDPSFGFKMAVPELLYNHGEIYNLCIRRGTLTQEERYKINEHMVFTIMMLEQMKFPKSLKRVPEYAGTHHEGLNGRGYPRRLGASDLSVPARIMAVADVFEALTAPDRPYKKPNKVSEAVKILHGLKKSRYIDSDIFDLFLTSGLYLRYAEKYLKPEQIDTVDIAPYLGAVPG
ncbi:MAG: HD domain-containing phosphohydrolase [Rhodoferax sp.]|nr:HD domain-containing phosphohydrolase [Rhodoferax sp.]